MLLLQNRSCGWRTGLARCRRKAVRERESAFATAKTRWENPKKEPNVLRTNRGLPGWFFVFLPHREARVSCKRTGECVPVVPASCMILKMHGCRRKRGANRLTFFAEKPRIGALSGNRSKGDPFYVKHIVYSGGGTVSRFAFFASDEAHRAAERHRIFNRRAGNRPVCGKNHSE